MVHALTLYQVRTSWLILGPSGREIAVKGVLELCEAHAAQGLCVTLCVSRGLCGQVDLVVLVSAPEVSTAEAFQQELSVRTAGRHLKVLDRRLAFGGPDLPQGEFLAFSSVRGPLYGDYTQAIVDIAAPADAQLWRALGPGPSDFVLASSATRLEDLALLHGRLHDSEVLASVPVTVLAIGRRLGLEEAFARFS